jgi:16S rRNA (cytidine1402-2'-O)-methyltransferase
MQNSFTQNKPTLYIVSTPIGNLSDMTYRAVEILKSVDMIFAEDTRTSKVLLNHYGIETSYQSYHEHNKFEKIPIILNLLEAGKNLALISDAGTPLVSDPGNDLVQSVVENGFYVVGIPGASAALTALVSSGLIAQPFTFIGFLPKKQKAMKDELNKYKLYETTLIIYESPNRIKETLEAMYEVFGNRKISLARELTKKFETIIRSDLESVQTMELDTRGEYTLVVEGFAEDLSNLTINDVYNTMVKNGIDPKDALKLTAEKLGIPKREVYQKIKIENT